MRYEVLGIRYWVTNLPPKAVYRELPHIYIYIGPILRAGAAGTHFGIQSSQLHVLEWCRPDCASGLTRIGAALAATRPSQSDPSPITQVRTRLSGAEATPSNN